MVIFHKNFNLLEQYSLALKLKEFNGIDIPQKLKEYESFKGRIDFTNFIELFNFESNIYSDKQFKYSLISNNNKRLIPEFISGAFAKLIYDGLVDIEIRTKLEQYLIAIMSNLDYRSYATLEQLKNEIQNNQSSKTFYYILGSCPLSYKEHKFKILKERIDTATKFYNIIHGTNTADKAKLKIFLRNTDEQTLYNSQIKPYISTMPIDAETETHQMPYAKLTKEEVTHIFNQVNANANSEYNLILFASTYHTTKVAQEIEKYFYENTSINYPKNIFIIGTEKFFDLISNHKLLKIQANKNKTSVDEIFILKKMQSFLFEIFMHSLDRNKQK